MRDNRALLPQNYHFDIVSNIINSHYYTIIFAVNIGCCCGQEFTSEHLKPMLSELGLKYMLKEILNYFCRDNDL